MNFNVINKKRMHNYIGMNWYAAHELGIKFPHNRNTILVLSSLNPSIKKLVISHEKREFNQMKMGLHYNEAHANATHQTIEINGKEFDI